MPKDIRLNCSHYIIFESPTKRENESICNEQIRQHIREVLNTRKIFYILINQERLSKGFLLGIIIHGIIQ